MIAHRPGKLWDVPPSHCTVRNNTEQKTSEFRSEPYCGRENNSEFPSVEQNISKLLEFPSEHFSGRENNSEFRSVETKIEAYSQNSLPNPSAEEKTTRNSVSWKKYRSKLSEFRFEPFRGRETCSTQNAAAQNVKKVSEKTTFEVWRIILSLV